jgi:hypothetical protein
VKARILSDTVCHPHGDVAAGDEITVSLREFFVLKGAGKAELVIEDKPATETSGGGAGEVITLDQAKAELSAKTKAQLVEIAKEEFALDLDVDNKKDDLIAAILDAAVKAR